MSEFIVTFIIQRYFRVFYKFIMPKYSENPVKNGKTVKNGLFWAIKRAKMVVERKKGISKDILVFFI